MGENRDGSFLRESQQLLDSAQAGHEDAAERLCRFYLPHLLRWAHGRLPRGARGLLETSDIVQEVFQSTLRNLKNFEYRGIGSFQSYLRQAVVNRVREEVRRAARGPLARTWKEMAAPTASPLEEVLGSERLERYERALARLSPTDQDLITARVEMGLRYREIAELLQKPSADAARMAVNRALTRLVEEMSR